MGEMALAIVLLAGQVTHIIQHLVIIDSPCFRQNVWVSTQSMRNILRERHSFSRARGVYVGIRKPGKGIGEKNHCYFSR